MTGKVFGALVAFFEHMLIAVALPFFGTFVSSGCVCSPVGNLVMPVRNASRICQGVLKVCLHKN